MLRAQGMKKRVLSEQRILKAPKARIKPFLAFLIGFLALFACFHFFLSQISGGEAAALDKTPLDLSPRVPAFTQHGPPAPLFFSQAFGLSESRSPGFNLIPYSSLLDLEKATLSVNRRGEIFLDSIPSFSSSLFERAAGRGAQNEIILYSVDPHLQSAVSKLVASSRAAHVAVVAMEAKTGRIIAIDQNSKEFSNLALHASFPAASLFKIVTAAAALEKKAINAEEMVYYRGGTYTLERWNYRPDRSKDSQAMSVKEAMGKSCNPVFGRIALKHLNAGALSYYARRFGFNTDLSFDIPLPESMATIDEDDFGLSRTAAGFGRVFISPVHAASFISAIANRGNLLRPALVDQVSLPSGNLIYKSKPAIVQKAVSEETAQELLKMLEYTTTIGTSRRAFNRREGSTLENVRVAGKTGTLRGQNPRGINNWFVGTAPLEDPQISVAVIVVDPERITTRASEIGRMIFEEYFK